MCSLYSTLLLNYNKESSCWLGEGKRVRKSTFYNLLLLSREELKFSLE